MTTYILAGKLLSVIVLFIFKKLVVFGYLKLSIHESLLGWFLIEYLYEDYSITAGNLFFTLNNFRTLISNFFLEFKELLFKFYLTPFFKYSFIFLIFLFLSYIAVFQNRFLPLNFFFSFYFYNLICYSITLNLYWVNLILVFYLIFNITTNFYLLKLELYLFSYLVLLSQFIKGTVEVSFLTNNFFQEELLKPLFIYSYMYYY